MARNWASVWRGAAAGSITFELILDRPYGCRARDSGLPGDRDVEDGVEPSGIDDRLAGCSVQDPVTARASSNRVLMRPGHIQLLRCLGPAAHRWVGYASRAWSR